MQLGMLLLPVIGFEAFWNSYGLYSGLGAQKNLIQVPDKFIPEQPIQQVRYLNGVAPFIQNELRPG